MFGVSFLVPTHVLIVVGDCWFGFIRWYYIQDTNKYHAITLIKSNVNFNIKELSLCLVVSLDLGNKSSVGG